MKKLIISLCIPLVFIGCGKKKPVQTINPQTYLTSEPITVTLNIDATDTEQIFPTKDLSVTITEEASPKMEKLVKLYNDFVILKYGKNDKKNAELVAIKKQDEMREVTDLALELIREQRNYPEVAQAIYLGGMAELQYAHMMLRYPMPTYFNELAEMFFQEEIIKYIAELIKNSRHMHEKLVFHAMETGVRGEWAEKSLQSLSEFYPLDFKIPESTHPSLIETYSRRLRYEDKMAIFSNTTWSSEKEERQLQREELEDIERNIEDWTKQCEILQAEVEIFDPDSVSYCIGLNITKVLHLTASHPKLPPKILELHQMYLQKVFEIIESIPEDKSGLYWKKELQDITYEEVRYLELNKRFKVRKTNVSTDAIERVFEFQESTEPIEPTILKHIQTHAFRIHNDAAVLAKRVKTTSGLNTSFFLRDFQDRFNKVKEDAMWILSYYPEDPESKARIIYGLGEVQYRLSKRILEEGLIIPKKDLKAVLEVKEKYGLEGARMLMHLAEQEGDIGKWKIQADILLRE